MFSTQFCYSKAEECALKAVEAANDELALSLLRDARDWIAAAEDEESERPAVTLRIVAE